MRTNFYRNRPAIAVKLDPRKIPELPLPRPRHEIWVCGPRVEGVHLRGGDIARGGLRWSDRREDFRTEVLGLMKAQMVKNAVIVPNGAKGGFVVKRPPTDPDGIRAEVVECYRAFIRGMLDLTDNLVSSAGSAGGPSQSSVVHPPDTVVYDGDDTYLVVAADKGTATFSDIANEIAIEYGFWLGDAFASGGSAGYDHKAMGITARGAWESVRRHASVLGRDADRDPLSAVGIGDMSGDVFGNGMLRSQVAAPRRRLRPPARLRRSGPRPGGVVRRAPAVVPAAPLELGRLRRRADLGRWRCLPADDEVDRAEPRGARRTRRTGWAR